MSKAVNTDAKLGINKFYIDQGNPHVALVENPDPDEFAKLETACPAGLFKRDEHGHFHFDSTGCLECGTCRILCGDTIINRWSYPQGTFGVEFYFG